jgi:Tfp pilus assembly protein PilX
MKIVFRHRPSNQGSILFVALILALVMCLSLAGYLTVVSGQQRSVARSQRWNASLNLAEAGIEEGLAQVNGSPNDFSANSWQVSNSTNYSPGVSRTLIGGTYTLFVQGSNNPTIYATGIVSAPLSGTLMTRTVRVTTQVLPLFNVGLGAVGNINMNGNGMATDSWNSQKTNLSTAGQYDSSKISTNGDVASQQGIVNIGNHTIDGNLYLGPTASYTSGTNQIMGDLDKNYNVNFPDVKLPYQFGSAVTANIVNSSGNKTNWITTDGYYNINNNFPIVVQPGVRAKVQITTQNFNNSITLQGGMTNSATLEVYDNPPASGGSFSLAGNNVGGAVSATPLNFFIYGLPNMTSITLSGNSSFIGAIYAPEAVLTLNGGGSSNNLMGAAIVKQVTLNGHYDFHYDEALASWGPAKSFTPNSWQEITASGQTY